MIDKTYTYYNNDYGVANKKLGACSWTTKEPVEPSRTTISLNGIQMRGAFNGWYYYLVLKSDAYESLSKDVEGIDGAIAKTSLDKIHLYTSADDTTGISLSDLTVQHIGRNIWGETGAFINFAEYDSAYGGHQVYKVTIEKGCEILADEANLFVVDKTYTYYNSDFGDADKKLSAMNWSATDLLSAGVQYEKISVNGIQMRGWEEEPWYQFLTILSDSYEGLDTVDSVPQWKNDFTADKIKLYTRDSSGKETAVSLADLTVQHIATNMWLAKGAFINFAEYANGYDGAEIYKIEIEKGCKIPAGAKDGHLVVFVVDKNYTYYNNSYQNESKRYGNFDWSKYEVPDAVENTGNIKISTVTNQSDGNTRYLILRLPEKFKETVSVSFFETKGFSNILDNVLLYSGDDMSAEPIKLRDVWTGDINLAQYSSKPDIGFSIENEEYINGTNLYAVRILAGCQIPYMEDGVYSIKTLEKTVTFVNLQYGLSGDIPGGYDSVYQVAGKYENNATNWAQAAFINYEVEGLEGVSYDEQLLISGSKIDFSDYEQDGYDLEITDNLGNTYYNEVVVPKEDVTLTLTYKVPEETEPEEEESNYMIPIAVGAAAVVVVAAGGTTFVIRKRIQSHA